MKITTILFLALLPFISFSQGCVTYGTGVDGAYLASSTTTIAGGTYNFTSFTIDSGVTVTVTGTAPLIVYCTGTATLNGVLSVSGANGNNGVTFSAGGTGGIGVAGGGNGGGGSYASSTGPIDGTDGFNTGGVSTKGAGWSGGGGAGYATNGLASGGVGGFAGSTYGDVQLSSLLAGSGGGGGSGGYDCGAGGGGAGGGIISLSANSILIGAAGSIQSNGGNGGSDGTGNCGGGGAGSGGAIWITAPTITNNGTISAIGGTGGASAIAGTPYFGIGGNGANGRIRIDVNGAVSGAGSITPVIGYSANVSIIETSQTLTVCAGDSITVGSTTYTTSGNYVDVLTASGGCDSTVTTNLTVLNALGSSQTLTVCAGESVTVGSSTYTTSGNYVDVLTASGGCDSTVTTNLMVLQAIGSSQTLTVCAGDSVAVGSSTYTTSGNYVDVLTASGGCDSTVTTNLTVQLPVDITVTINQGSMQVGESNAGYQWLDCDANNAPIAQATNQTFIPTVNGNYAVEVTVDGCSSTSACTNYNLIGINEFADLAIQLYPNPTSSVVTVSFGIEVPVEQLTVTDVTGRLVHNQSQFTATSLEIDLSREGKGVYFLNVEVNGRVQTLKITKQ